MDAVKLREHYQQALLLLSNLQNQEVAALDRSLSKLSLAVRLCYSIQKTASSLHDKDSGSIWQQRSASLHNDLTTATAQVLQSSDQSGEQFWDGCLRLLYLGAEAYEQIESEKDLLVSQLLAEREQCARLEQTVQSQRKNIEMNTKESVELRTKVAVLEQSVERLEENSRELFHRLEVTIKEKNSLSIEKERLAEDRTRNLQILERQGNAIQQLMQQCESSTKEKDDALESLNSVNEDNHTLRINLGQHGQVIENLININAEMMDAANSFALQLEQKKLQEQQQTEKQSSLVDSARTSEKSLDIPDLQIESVVPLPVQEKQDFTETVPAKLVTGPSQDFFSRIKGKESIQDTLDIVSTAEQQYSFKENIFDVDNVGKPHAIDEAAKRKTVAWTSDMLISQRVSASLEDLQGLEKKVVQANGSASLGDLNNLEESFSKVSSNSPGLFERFGGMGGRLQGVGGKAKGFLNFVAGADLASV